MKKKTALKTAQKPSLKTAAAAKVVSLASIERDLRDFLEGK